MPQRNLTLLLLEESFAICRLEPYAPIPAWIADTDFYSITRTGDEMSIVCNQAAVPEAVRCEQNWRCLRVAGTLPCTAVGVLSGLIAPLALAGVSVFVLSTFDTDYLFVQEEDLETAVDTIRRQGHAVSCGSGAACS